MTTQAEQQDRTTGSGFGHIFQKNRWWSNPGLSDVDTMIALILSDPTRVDLALAAALWSVDRIERVRSSIDPELTPLHRQVLDPIYASVLQGVRHAHERVA